MYATMLISLLKFSRKISKLPGRHRMSIKDVHGWGKFRTKLDRGRGGVRILDFLKLFQTSFNCFLQKEVYVRLYLLLTNYSVVFKILVWSQVYLNSIKWKRLHFKQHFNKFLNHGPTTIHKIFETNSSFHAKQHTTGKVQFLFLRKLLLVLAKLSFRGED